MEAGARQVALVAGTAPGLGGLASRLEEHALGVVRVEAPPSGIGEAIGRVIEEIGPPDLLVIVPGSRQAAAFGTLDADGWAGLLDTHLGTAVGACRAALPAMVEAGRGVVVVLLPSVVRSGGSGRVYEAAAAGTLVGFAKSLAGEVAARGVRVNLVTVPDAQGADVAAAVADTVAFLARHGDFYVGQVFAPAVM